MLPIRCPNVFLVCVFLKLTLVSNRRSSVPNLLWVFCLYSHGCLNSLVLYLWVRIGRISRLRHTNRIFAIWYIRSRFISNGTRRLPCGITEAVWCIRWIYLTEGGSWTRIQLILRFILCNFVIGLVAVAGTHANLAPLQFAPSTSQQIPIEYHCTSHNTYKPRGQTGNKSINEMLIWLS